MHLLPGLDNLLALRSWAGRALVDPTHHTIPLIGMGARGSISVGEVRWPHQRPIVQDGEWIGVWEWDLDAGQAVGATFGPAGAANDAIRDALATQSRFIADELDGAWRTYSVDSEKFLRARLAAMQAFHRVK